MLVHAIVPRFAHDCEKCQFLGCYDGHDLYCCAEHGDYEDDNRVEVIARYGDSGPAYKSFPIDLAKQLVDHTSVLYVAALLGERQ